MSAAIRVISFQGLGAATTDAAENKPSAIWQRQTQATEFIEFIVDTMSREHSLLMTHWTLARPLMYRSGKHPL